MFATIARYFKVVDMIDDLTPEQKALMPIYLEKWRNIVLSTERINQNKAAESVISAYVSTDYEQPKLFFQDSPYKACNFLLERLTPEFLENYLNEPNSIGSLFPAHFKTIILNYLRQRVGNKIFQQLHDFFDHLVDDPLNNVIFNNLIDILYAKPNGEIEDDFWWIEVQLKECFTPEYYYRRLASLDFCFSVLNLVQPPPEWEIFKSLVQECGWIFAYDDICIVCDRPLHLRFDEQNRLHAEGEPAIEFTDGYSLYFHHGVALPEEYGKVHPKEWRSQWLLKQDNAELRRVLIQGIGYARICEELQARELDSWSEYTLLQIDNSIDVEPICLLKMTCPSTGSIHVLRVPPDTNSAREAVRWVNWGVDPEDFAVQT